MWREWILVSTNWIILTGFDITSTGSKKPLMLWNLRCSVDRSDIA